MESMEEVQTEKKGEFLQHFFRLILDVVMYFSFAREDPEFIAS